MNGISAQTLFREAGVVPNGTASWGNKIGEAGPGVYVISIRDPTSVQFDGRFEAERTHWLDGQTVIYIGRSRRLARRLGQFYRHRYGARSPHRGGQAILLLDCDKLVTWAATDDYAGAEHRLLEAFERSVGRRPFGNRMRSARMG